MDIVDLLTQAQGAQGLQSIGRQFGLNEEQTRAAVEQLAPAVAAGLRRNTQTSGGVVDLITALASGSHGRYADDPQALQSDAAASEGNAILGHIFGGKDVSRGVANQAADLSGVGSAILKKMLPVIAAAVMGALAKQMMGGGARSAPAPSGGSGQGGGLGDILGQVLGGGNAPGQSGGRAARSAPAPSGGSGQGGGLGDILGQVFGGGNAPGQSGGGLGDVLGQVLGGGSGQAQTASVQPGGLEEILRQVLGAGSAGGQAAAPSDGGAAVRRGRDILGDILGQGTASGNAADSLLASVEQAVRRR
jgi:hypothetical protein